MYRIGPAKRLIRLALSAGFFAVTRLWELAGRVAGKMPPGTCVILYYHDIPSHQRERFARQMDALRRLARPVPADWRGPLEPGERYCAVTFDDAFASVAANALPALAQRGIPSTVFVITCDLEADPEASRAGARRRMTADEVLALRAEGVEIGSHSVSHVPLTRLGTEEARREIVGSRAALEKLLGERIGTFSFPYGAFDARLVELCREAGYTRVFTTEPRLALRQPGELVSGRVSAEPGDWPLEFRLKLLGAYRWLPAAIALKRRLIGAPR